MAFRIHESVVHGEIDNRAKGMVRGRIWVVGRSEPIVLELKGNAWPDLAGCLLNFRNPQKPIAHPHVDLLHALQRGTIGDLTASRKDLIDFICEFQTTGAKLAGALGNVARGEQFGEPAFTVAYLKRALDHLHKSQAGLERVAPKKLLPEPLIAEARKELFEIREGILHLMDDFRGRA